MGRQVQEWQVPGAMKALLMALYHLDRGPLLGGVAGHADEHSQLHAAMVQAGMSLGSAMVVPQLWRMLPDGSWHLSPPVDLALLPMSVLVSRLAMLLMSVLVSKALQALLMVAPLHAPGRCACPPADPLACCPPQVLDHGTHIFVWLGGQAAAAAHADLLRAAALRLVDALQRGRFPPPETRVISQGHGDTRYVLSRLAPAHRDPESMHATHWPPLRDAGDDLRRALVRGVPPSDQPSFAEWCLKRGMVLSDEVDPEAVAEVLKG